MNDSLSFNESFNDGRRRRLASQVPGRWLARVRSGRPFIILPTPGSQPCLRTHTASWALPQRAAPPLAAAPQRKRTTGQYVS